MFKSDRDIRDQIDRDGEYRPKSIVGAEHDPCEHCGQPRTTLQKGICRECRKILNIQPGR